VKNETVAPVVAGPSCVKVGGGLRHLNLLGEYDFSEDKLQDSVGIKPPKLTD
jgi:hypothetical protein